MLQEVNKLKHINLFIPEKWLEQIDKLVEKNAYPNRSEALRVVIREGMKREGIWNRMMQTVIVEGKDNSKKTVTKEKALGEVKESV